MAQIKALLWICMPREADPAKRPSNEVVLRTVARASLEEQLVVARLMYLPQVANGPQALIALAQGGGPWREAVLSNLGRMHVVLQDRVEELQDLHAAGRLPEPLTLCSCFLVTYVRGFTLNHLVIPANFAGVAFPDFV